MPGEEQDLGHNEAIPLDRGKERTIRKGKSGERQRRSLADGVH